MLKSQPVISIITCILFLTERLKKIHRPVTGKYESIAEKTLGFKRLAR